MQLKRQRYTLPLGLAVLLMAGLVVIGFDDSSFGLAGAWSGLIVEIQSLQRDLHRQLSAGLQTIRDQGMVAAWGLVGLSFLYGVFHAAGPGHGKVVISTYMLTQKTALKRGLTLTVLSSLCQGLTAIVAVEITVRLLELSMRQAQRTATDLELISYALVALAGLILIISPVRRLYKSLRAVPAPALAAHASDHHNHDHDHDHLHSHDHAHTHEHDHALSHDHGHDHGTCGSCGHAHGPTPAELAAPATVWSSIGIIASIGIRPCSGALVVLLVAHSAGLYWAGLAAVMAMSVGTAITISALATLSIYARAGALRLLSLMPERTRSLTMAVEAVAILGGLVILLLGLMLFQAAWTAPVHPLR